MYTIFCSNPAEVKFSISLWLKVVSPHSGYQTVVGSGSPNSNTGFLVRVQNMGKTIIGYLITSGWYLNARCDTLTTDTLKKWTHLALTNDVNGERSIDIYKISLGESSCFM